MKKYELHALVDKFTDDSKKYKEIAQKDFDDFLNDNPGEEMPDHIKDPFNLPLAFASICQEILNLKNNAP